MSSRLCDVCKTQQPSTHYVPARRRFECDACENEMETNLTVDEVKEILTRPGYDAYGYLRIYAIWHDQIVSVKSMYDVERFTEDAVRFYSRTNNGTVPIRRATRR
jgi:prefoldin subunit 5